MEEIKLAHQTEIEPLLSADDKDNPAVDDLRRGWFIENGYIYKNPALVDNIIWN